MTLHKTDPRIRQESPYFYTDSAHLRARGSEQSSHSWGDVKLLSGICEWWLDKENIPPHRPSAHQRNWRPHNLQVNMSLDGLKPSNQFLNWLYKQ